MGFRVVCQGIHIVLQLLARFKFYSNFKAGRLTSTSQYLYQQAICIAYGTPEYGKASYSVRSTPYEVLYSVLLPCVPVLHKSRKAGEGGVVVLKDKNLALPKSLISCLSVRPLVFVTTESGVAVVHNTLESCEVGEPRISL
jgi:hypothetical protein